MQSFQPEAISTAKYQARWRRASIVLCGLALLEASAEGYLCFRPVPGEFTFSLPGVFCIGLHALLMGFAVRARKKAFP